MSALPAESSTRDRLLSAAVEVFVEQGYEGARVQDIARSAGMTTGAIYANFRGKGELLFDAIGARAGAEMDAIITEARSRETREFLEDLGDRLLQPREQAPLLVDAIAAARRDDELAAALRHRLNAREEMLIELVEGGQRAGTIEPSVDAHAFARFSMTLAMGALVMRTLRMTQPDAPAWHNLLSLLLDAVFQETSDEQ